MLIPSELMFLPAEDPTLDGSVSEPEAQSISTEIGVCHGVSTQRMTQPHRIT
jgi:hypothetical protein